jgi:hypothetical protein
VLIVLSMAVGLFAVGIILSSRTILSDGLATSFAAINPSSGTVRTSELFDENFLASVRAMPHVQEADARRSVGARVEAEPGKWKNITLFVVADYEDIRVNKVSTQSGAWPPPKHEILIERSALPVVGARVGDTVRIKMPSDTQRVMRISGIAHDPAQMPAQLDGTPYGYITFDTLDWLGEAYGFNELHIISSRPQDKAWSQRVVNEVKDKAEKSGYTIPLTMNADPGQLPMDAVLQGILLLMGLLGVMSLFLSIFLVVNTVSALLAQQKRQIGVMKAVGGSTLQILGMYLAMVISYGVLALLIAIPLGMQGARLLSQAMASYFNFDLPAAFRDPIFRPSRTMHAVFDREVYANVRGQDLGNVRGQPIQPLLAGLGEPFTDWLFQTAMHARPAESAFCLRAQNNWGRGSGWLLVFALRWLGKRRRLTVPDSLIAVFKPEIGPAIEIAASEALGLAAQASNAPAPGAEIWLPHGSAPGPGRR